MKTNKKAVTALMALVLITLLIFFTEKKYLVAEPRGETLSKYEKIHWADKIILLIDDFEGLKKDSSSFKNAKIFTFGSAKISINDSIIDTDPMASMSALKVEWAGNDNFGGWGKGVGANVDLNVNTDFFNFRVYVPKSHQNNDSIKIIIQEDDNDDGILEEDKDDFWAYKVSVPAKDEWQFISIPLKDFYDDNVGGDHIFNVTKKRGIHNIIFSFEHPEKYTKEYKWYFDFVCFTNEKINEKTM